MSESWVAWALLMLLILLFVNRLFLLDLSVVVQGLFSRAERSYVDASWQSQLLAWVYRIGIVAMVDYMYVHTDGECVALDYLLVVAVVACVLLLQYGIARLVGEVFFASRQIGNVFEYRNCIYNVISALLWPVALVIRFCESETIVYVICWVMLALLVILLVWKAIQLLCRSLRSILYVLLYVTCVEVFPLIGALTMINQILG